MANPIQIRSPQALINRARFAGKDFFTVVDDVTARIKSTFGDEYDEFISSSTGQMLIDIFAWTAETMSFYIDRQASESYLATARTRTAVANLARQVGYKPSRVVSATVDLSVNLSATHAFDVTIPKGFAFQGPNGLQFESLQDVTFPAGEGPTSTARSVAVREGTTRTSTFTSDGSKKQVFQLTAATGKEILDGVTAVVDAVTWSESEFLTLDKTDQYEVDYHSQPPLLRFGDGVAGNIPATGASINVTYVESSGSEGLVLAGSITDVVSPLSVMSTSIGLTLTNPLPSSGGSDLESIASIKANAPGFFAARGVAVTQEDYVALSQSYSDPLAGSVAVAQAFVAHSVSEDLTFLGLVTEAKATSTSVQSGVSAGTSDVRVQTAAISSAKTSVDTSTASIDAQLANIATNPLTSGVTGYVKDIRDAVQTLRSQVAQASADVTAGLADGTLAGKDTQFNAIQVVLDAMEANFDLVISGTSNTEGAVDTAATDSASVSSNATTIQAATDSINTDADTIDAAVGTNFVETLAAKLDEVSAHVDGFLSADCKANLVQVPILSKDADGFLVPPSNALVRSLETYLRERNEITQVVDVVSGEAWLVPADITGTLGIETGFVFSAVLSAVNVAIENLLRDRAFGASLRLSDLYSTVVPDPITGTGGVSGVTHAILKITGPLTYVDSDGNLVINANQIITRGTISISQEAA